MLSQDHSSSAVRNVEIGRQVEKYFERVRESMEYQRHFSANLCNAAELG